MRNVYACDITRFETYGLYVTTSTTCENFNSAKKNYSFTCTLNVGCIYFINSDSVCKLKYKSKYDNVNRNCRFLMVITSVNLKKYSSYLCLFYV